MALSRKAFKFFNFVTVLFLTLVTNGGSQKTQCGLYGSPPCDFVPVPRGATPPCAGIGKTYCEHVPNYPKTQIRKIIRQLQYDIQVHLVDEVPVEFNDMKTIPPDTTYGTPPVDSSPRPPSPTYGVPGHQPGRPSTVYEKPPSPTYGVPHNEYLPPPPTNNFQTNAGNNNFAFSSVQPTRRPNTGAGYVYNKPNANLINQPQVAQLRSKEDSNEKDSEEDEKQVKNIDLTTDSPPVGEPNFYFSEQFDHPQIPPPSPSTQPYQIIPSERQIRPIKPQQQPQRQQQVSQQQHAFHPEEQPFLPNSPPAPFSTAVYQGLGSNSRQSTDPPGQQQTEPLPTLSQHTQPPAVGAKDYYRYDSLPAPSTQYNQAEWFRRISRSLNKSEPLEEEKRGVTKPMNATLIEELRNKKETLKILFPEDQTMEDEEDLIIHFNTQTPAPIGGNRTRSKRQSNNFQSNELCETTTQFIEPQAALTRDGEWKYIVNQVESARQLVKVETCATTVCSNLCILPQGYSSKCEQKFVQKRLVTLDPGGTTIYTDTFWFPSCCVCTISNPLN